MVGCAVFNCNNNNNLKATKNSESKVRFFSFPKNLTLSKLWLQKCERKDKVNVANARICSVHFTPDDYLMKYRILDYSPKIKKLNADAIPSLNLPCSDAKPSLNLPCSDEKPSLNLPCSDTIKKQIPVQNRKRKRKLTNNINHDIADNKRLRIVNDNINEPDQEVIAEEVHSSIVDNTMHKNIGAQADQIAELKRIIYKQGLEIQKLKAKAERNEKALNKIFTSGQIKKLKSNMTKRIKWSANDIASAITLYAAGPVAYKLLRKRNYPLPTVSTLQTWAGKINVNPEEFNAKCVSQTLPMDAIQKYYKETKEQDVHFTKEDGELLLRITAEYKNIIESVESDAESLQAKEVVWAEITIQFNAQSSNEQLQTKNSLKQYYELRHLQSNSETVNQEEDNNIKIEEGLVEVEMEMVADGFMTEDQAKPVIENIRNPIKQEIIEETYELASRIKKERALIPVKQEIIEETNASTPEIEQIYLNSHVKQEFIDEEETAIQ